MSNNKCAHIECESDSTISEYCDFHENGGYFQNGYTYEQYQIIEEDFLNFIKIIPINDDNHLKIYSPILRDIILRCCIQIEIFFKEWSKYDFDSNLHNKYNETNKKTGKKKGSRNWKFDDYFPKKNKLVSTILYVSPLDKNIEPFANWSQKLEGVDENIPEWWDTYNGIKHDGVNYLKKATLKTALESLGALFLLHCNNHYTKGYLNQFRSNNIISRGYNFSLKMGQITTPIDSKRYLFKDVLNSPNRTIHITENTELKNIVSMKGKRM